MIVIVLYFEQETFFELVPTLSVFFLLIGDGGIISVR